MLSLSACQLQTMYMQTHEFSVCGFLPHDVMHKRSLCHHTASVTCVYCAEMAKDTAIVVEKCKYETVPKLSNGNTSMTLSDL